MLESLPHQIDRKNQIRRLLVSYFDQLRTKKTEVTVDVYTNIALESIINFFKNVIQM